MTTISTIYSGLTGDRDVILNIPTTGFGSNKGFNRKLRYDEVGLHRPKLLNNSINYSSSRGVLMCDNSLRVHQLRTPLENKAGKPQNMQGGGIFSAGLSAKRLIPASSVDAGSLSKFKR